MNEAGTERSDVLGTRNERLTVNVLVSLLLNTQLKGANVPVIRPNGCMTVVYDPIGHLLATWIQGTWTLSACSHRKRGIQKDRCHHWHSEGQH